MSVYDAFLSNSSIGINIHRWTLHTLLCITFYLLPLGIFVRFWSTNCYLWKASHEIKESGIRETLEKITWKKNLVVSLPSLVHWSSNLMSGMHHIRARLASSCTQTFPTQFKSVCRLGREVVIRLHPRVNYFTISKSIIFTDNKMIEN